ncbi:hypothetical protein TEA_000204 [Camellia sinensis var. sinensis]|uniref:HMG box domain-containing protein n=1 Tax=Camellia sinensis var. sinensis TaxID=542762 RepID=A0A4V3WJB5_CAMSN|nr:hypothetical protein TEA_000204 [Camellia sinensis var. sinensis]
MALSSDSMDNTFRARVQKIFGPFSSSSSSSSSSLSPPWSLIDDEVEKREWRRPSSAKDDDQTPISFSFDGLFTRNTRRQHDLQDINDYDDQLGGGRHSSEYVKGDGRDEWEIRSSIGLDSTLNNEEEEDEYDKVAEGRGIHSGCWCNATLDRMLARYVIPKGCFVVPFLSAVHLDENLYEGAITFNSWRWMDPLNQGSAMKGGRSKTKTKRTDSKLSVKRGAPSEKAGKKPAVKKGKAAKDPNKPKRPASAFFVFMEEFRKTYKEKHPSNKSVAAEKAPYVAKAEKRKTEYNKTLEAYNKKMAEGPADEEESDKLRSEVNDEDDEDDESGEEEDDDE